MRHITVDCTYIATHIFSGLEMHISNLKNLEARRKKTAVRSRMTKKQH